MKVNYGPSPVARHFCGHGGLTLAADVYGDGAPDAPQTMTRRRTATTNLRVPTLLIRGDLSDIVSDKSIEEFRALVPHAQVVQVADAAHMVAGDRNDRFGAAVLDFLARHWPV